MTPSDKYMKIGMKLNENDLPFRIFAKDREASAILPIDMEVGDFHYTPIKGNKLFWFCCMAVIEIEAWNTKVILMTTYISTMNCVAKKVFL